MNSLLRLPGFIRLAGFFTLLFLTSQCSVQHRYEWSEGPGYRYAVLNDPGDSGPGFHRMDGSETGVNFINQIDEKDMFQNRYLLNGSGVAMADVNGDGLCDIYFCRMEGNNQLYMNDGNWKFRETADESGVSFPGRFSTGAVFADTDGDNDMDLIVTAMGDPNAIFENDGNGKFTEITDRAGLESLPGRTGSTTMTLADIEGDGDLDLFVANYKRISKRDQNPIFTSSGYTLSRPSNAEPNLLYINNGNGNFELAPFTGERFQSADGRPSSMKMDWSLSARFQDMDNDNDPDLYVCNDFQSPDRIWINNGSGNFKPISDLAIRKTSLSSMAVDFSDSDKDGDMDYFIAEMLSREHSRRKTQMGAMKFSDVPPGLIKNRPQIMQNTFFLNRDNLEYAEISRYSGLHASEWTWSVMFLDVDLDGWEDIILTTGHLFDVQDSDTANRIRSMTIKSLEELQKTIMMYPPLKTPNFIFRNRGDLTFEETGKTWGFSESTISHGIAAGDLDNDGDMDVVINNLNENAGLFRNESSGSRMAVRLKGEKSNTRGIGSKIGFRDKNGIQTKEINAGGLYLSSSQPQVTFACSEPASIEVTWRSGKKSIIDDAKCGYIYEIDEIAALENKTKPEENTRPVFEDVSHLISHRHHERLYDDFKRQPLLPNRLSQTGPGIAWFDIDGDRDDDLIVTSGKGGTAGIFRNLGNGKFSSKRVRIKNDGDQTGIVGIAVGLTEKQFVFGISNYEGKSVPGGVVTNPAGDKIFDLPESISTTGPLSAADYDLDGDLDLFVGGRTIPGQYPAPSSSVLYLNENGSFITDETNSGVLNEIGMVSGSVFSDIDTDGDPDLVLAMEWGPVTILLNNNGSFENRTESYGLTDFSGWWNGITTGDFNNDGKPDIIASNWGLNSKYHAHPDHPLKIYYEDFDANGTLDIVEAHFDGLLNKLVPERGLSCMSNAMPVVKTRLPTYKQYSIAGLSEIIGVDPGGCRSVKASVLEHMVFINRTDYFETGYPAG